MLLDLLLPQRCVVCTRFGAPLCDRCRDALPAIREPLCARCGAPTAWPVQRCVECSGRRLAFATARAAVVYDAGVRAVVGAWKENGAWRLDELAAEVIADRLAPPCVAAVTFVPPDSGRRLQRGHHPAERLARSLARRWELPLEAILERHGRSERQRGLSLRERRRNVAGAFRPRCSAPGAIALVDDIYTSGATANAAASALRKAGARRVEVVTFARAVRGYTVRST